MEAKDRISIWPPAAISNHLKNRVADLRDAKKNGVKVMGYFPGNYVPEEIIYAAGAIPLCLSFGGSSHRVDVGLSVTPNHICPFCRKQIGEKLLKENIYYDLVDILVAPMTCIHLKKAADLWEYYTDIEVFKLGIPHQSHSGFALKYYENRLKDLKDRLEAFTGNEITEEKISEAIELFNKMRKVFRQLSEMRTSHNSPLSSLDFIKMNHASLIADPEFIVDKLNCFYQELQQSTLENTERPRLLLVGPNIGYGDYEILQLVEEAGGQIVAEEITEGVRDYWQHCENSNAPFKALACRYLSERQPGAFMASSARERLGFITKLLKEFHASGVIWYELLCCESYDAESYFFKKKLGDQNIPMLIIESDYSVLDTDQLRNRFEAFIELLRGREKNERVA